MTSCLLCRYLVPSPVEYDEKEIDVQLKHSSNHNSQMERFADSAADDKTTNSIIITFSRCFPTIASNMSAEEIFQRLKKIEAYPPPPNTCFIIESCREAAIFEYFKHLIRADYGIGRRAFECALCRRKVVIGYAKHGVSAHNALSHVLSRHMTDCKAYRCRYCKFETSGISTMCQHVKREHKTSNGGSAHFDDRTKLYRGEICEMLRRCFGKQPGNKNRRQASADPVGIRKAPETRRNFRKPAGGISSGF